MLTTLFDHMLWADARALDALRAMPPDAPELERAVTIYAHVAAAEHVWLSRLEGRTPVHPVWPSLDVERAAALARESGAALRAFVAALDDAGLAREVSYRNSAGQSFVNRVADILSQVALHGSYHRGQLAMLARQGGGAPAATDFIVFVRGAAVPAATDPPRTPAAG